MSTIDDFVNTVHRSAVEHFKAGNPSLAQAVLDRALYDLHDATAHVLVDQGRLADWMGYAEEAAGRYAYAADLVALDPDARSSYLRSRAESLSEQVAPAVEISPVVSAQSRRILDQWSRIWRPEQASLPRDPLEVVVTQWCAHKRNRALALKGCLLALTISLAVALVHVPSWLWWPCAVLCTFTLVTIFAVPRQLRAHDYRFECGWQAIPDELLTAIARAPSIPLASKAALVGEGHRHGAATFENLFRVVEDMQAAQRQKCQRRGVGYRALLGAATKVSPRGSQHEPEPSR